MKTLLPDYDKKQIAIAIGKELHASNLYKDVANKLQRLGYFGAQSYFLKESAHELEHYQIWVDYCNDRGDLAQMPAIPAMKCKIESLKDALTEAYDIEVELGDFYDSFCSESEDPTTKERLLEFIKIQRKSVGELGDLLARLAIVGDDKCGQLMMDEYMKGL